MTIVKIAKKKKEYTPECESALDRYLRVVFSHEEEDKAILAWFNDLHEDGVINLYGDHLGLSTVVDSDQLNDLKECERLCCVNEMLECSECAYRFRSVVDNLKSDDLMKVYIEAKNKNRIRSSMRATDASVDCYVGGNILGILRLKSDDLSYDGSSHRFITEFTTLNEPNDHFGPHVIAYRSKFGRGDIVYHTVNANCIGDVADLFFGRFYECRESKVCNVPDFDEITRWLLNGGVAIFRMPSSNSGPCPPDYVEELPIFLYDSSKYSMIISEQPK